MKQVSEDLSGVISQMLKPLKAVQLKNIIEGLSGFEIIPFDKFNKLDIQLLKELEVVANEAGKKININGIKRSRPNEVGNDIESFVRDALDANGYKASIPTTLSGKRKNTGYPDIQFYDKSNRLNYLECKTYSIDNINSSFRSFYLSPSVNFKVTDDAHHFLLSYEIYTADRIGSNNIYKCKSWKILTLENLICSIKYEFNVNNKELYDKSLLLAEGKL